jgi:hypothetical protein
VQRFLAASGSQPALAKLVLEYWRVLGEIVLSAEERMIERGNGRPADTEAETDRARLRRLEELEERFDEPDLRRIKRLLPFSRNDMWEVDELRQQLRHG